MAKGKSAGWEFKPKGDANSVSIGTYEIPSSGLSGEDASTYNSLLPFAQGDEAVLTFSGEPVIEEGEVVGSESYNHVKSPEEPGDIPAPMTEESAPAPAPVIASEPTPVEEA